MKCNQCEMLQISAAGVSLPCHEIGCPNAHKVWDDEEQEWVMPEPEQDEDDFIYDQDDEEDDNERYWDGDDKDRGGTGHGDISWSDADPGL